MRMLLDFTLKTLTYLMYAVVYGVVAFITLTAVIAALLTTPLVAIMLSFIGIAALCSIIFDFLARYSKHGKGRL